MPKDSKLDIKRFLVPNLRRISYKWPGRTAAIKAATTEPGQRLCAMCNKEHYYKNCHVDHINPVVPLTGFDDWNGYITRLFCDPEALQVLCTDCHQAKTDSEKTLRKHYNTIRKETDAKITKKRNKQPQRKASASSSRSGRVNSIRKKRKRKTNKQQ